MDEITYYKPKSAGPWGGVFKRVINHEDDGHAAKLIRALAHGEQICKPYENDQKFKIKGKMWLQLGHMGEWAVLYPKIMCLPGSQRLTRSKILETLGFALPDSMKHGLSE